MILSVHMSALLVRRKEYIEPVNRGDVKLKQRGGLLAVRVLGDCITHADKINCVVLTTLHGKIEEWREWGLLG